MESCGCCKHSVRWSQERNGGLGVLQTLGRWSRPPVAAGRIGRVKEADSICNLTGGLWWCENHRDAKKLGENAANDSCAVSAP